ncbi:hypothetical protein [Nocardia harenae]|uniref:hypothetical protein n=1 Tax=Nocardia harenae TaxID=358707 RepID=UPI000836E3D7|nr:hypothetical protein [Nocardia harenae]
MRESLFRKATACLGLAVVASAVLVGCGSDDESDTAASSTEAAATTTAAAPTADAATTQAITQAYTVFFDATQPAEKRAALVESGDAFLPILQGQASNPQGQGTSVALGAIELVDANNADVGYSLLINGAPVLPDQTGQAVKDGGTWKVASATFCALIAIQGGTSPAC